MVVLVTLDADDVAAGTIRAILHLQGLLLKKRNLSFWGVISYVY